MSSTSPGDGGEKDSSDTIRQSRATGVRSSLSERVGWLMTNIAISHSRAEVG